MITMLTVLQSQGIFLANINLKSSPWYPGDLLLFDVYESLFHSSFKSRIKELLTVYCEQLLEQFSVNKTDEDGYPLLKGNAIDFVFRNLIKHGGSFVYIDNEWYSKEDIPIDHILYRCIISDIIPVRYHGTKNDIGDPEEFILELIRLFFPKYNRERLCKNRIMEDRFITSVLVEFNPESIFEQDHVLTGQEVAELEAVSNELKITCTELKTIRNSHCWKFLTFYYKFKEKIFPPNTKRKANAKRLWKIISKMISASSKG